MPHLSQIVSSICINNIVGLLFQRLCWLTEMCSQSHLPIFLTNPCAFGMWKETEVPAGIHAVTEGTCKLDTGVELWNSGALAFLVAT